jgi:hypothetical protein
LQNRKVKTSRRESAQEQGRMQKSFA